MSKHTPGPWKSQILPSGSENDKGFCVTARNGRSRRMWIADVSPVIDNERGDASEEGKANARLIAAAPDLLKEAKLAELFLREQDERNPFAAGLRAAIAKAEGK